MLTHRHSTSSLHLQTVLQLQLCGRRVLCPKTRQHASLPVFSLLETFQNSPSATSTSHFLRYDIRPLAHFLFDSPAATPTVTRTTSPSISRLSVTNELRLARLCDLKIKILCRRNIASSTFCISKHSTVTATKRAYLESVLPLADTIFIFQQLLLYKRSIFCQSELSA